MALTLTEARESGNGSIGIDGQDEYSAIVSGSVTDDRADDVATIMAYAAPRFSLVSAMGNICTNITRTWLGPGTWLVTAHYTPPQWVRQTNDASFSFSTSGGTGKIFNSYQTVATYTAAGETAPDYHGAINVRDGSVEGVDIDIPVFNFRTTFYLSSSDMTSGYAENLKNLQKRINSDVVTLNVDGVQLTFQPGELKFVDTEGSKRRGFGDWELALNWSASPNITNQTISGINVVSKRGWDYLWIATRKDNDAAGFPIEKPVCAKIEKVYIYDTLSVLIPATGFGQTNVQVWKNGTPTSGAGVS